MGGKFTAVRWRTDVVETIFVDLWKARLEGDVGGLTIRRDSRVE